MGNMRFPCGFPYVYPGKHRFLCGFTHVYLWKLQVVFSDYHVGKPGFLVVSLMFPFGNSPGFHVGNPRFSLVSMQKNPGAKGVSFRENNMESSSLPSNMPVNWSLQVVSMWFPN